jgi:hypothetical protein
VVPAQLSNDPQVVIDERMFDSLPQGIGEDLLSGIKITGLQRLNADGDFCFERMWQVLLRESPPSGPEIQQKNDTEARVLPWRRSKLHRLGTNTRHSDSSSECGSATGLI